MAVNSYQSAGFRYGTDVEAGLRSFAAQHNGIPGQCSAAGACGSYIKAMKRNALQTFPRFAIPPDVVQGFWDRYNTFYRAGLRRCFSIGDRDPVVGAICLSQFEKEARELASQPPLPAVIPSSSPYLPSGPSFLPARSEYVPLGPSTVTSYLPTPEEMQSRRNVYANMSGRGEFGGGGASASRGAPTKIPTLVTPRPVERHDIKIVDTNRKVERVDPAPAEKEKAEETKGNTMLYVGLGGIGLLVAYLVVKKGR